MTIVFFYLIRLISLGNYNVANIIQNAKLYRNKNDENDAKDDSDIDSDEIEPDNDDIKIEDVNKKDEHRRTPLHLAVLNGDMNLVKKLLEHNADVNAVDDVGATALHRAAEKGK